MHRAEIQEELEFHLAMEEERQSPRDARIRLGNATLVGEETRGAGILGWLESTAQDVRYGLRALRQSPALTAAVALSIALGAGANTAIFSLVDAALLRPLPVHDPDSLRVLQWTSPSYPDGVENINGNFTGIAGGRQQGSSVSAALYRDMARQQSGYAALMGRADPNQASVAVGANPADQISLEYVSANFFQGLGVAIPLGRAFLDSEDRPGTEPVAVVSERFWRQRLSAAADAAGTTIRVNDQPVRIVGVAAAGFFGTYAGQWVDVYVPLSARPVLSPAYRLAYHGENDRDWWVWMVARLKPGIPEAAALSQTASLFHNLAAQATGQEPRNTPELISLPGRRGVGDLGTRERDALWILTLLVDLLMLLVCANVANLLLARSVGRQRESAVRLALGASRLRIFRQFLVESALLALLGGAAGLLLGSAIAQSLDTLFANSAIGAGFDVHMGGRTLAYATALSIAVAFLFGLAPAIRAARTALGPALKTQARGVTGGRMRMPRLLVCVQIALCLSSLVAAGLLGRSLENLKSVDTGFDRRNLAYLSVSPLQGGYTPERQGPYMDRLCEGLSRIPGVMRVSVTEVRLVAHNGNAFQVHVPGQLETSREGAFDRSRASTLNRVGEGYFEAMGIRLLAGRAFAPQDFHKDSEAAIVSKQFADHFFPYENPLGKRFGFTAKSPSMLMIVGVVADTSYRDLRDRKAPNLYQPLVPEEYRGVLHFVMRTAVDPQSLAPVVRRTVAEADSAVPLLTFRTQTELIDGALRTERLLSFLSGAFGIAALALAAIGLGGLQIYAVARRTNEIGVRMALGARAASVIGMVLRDALWMTAGGTLLGLPCAYFVARALKSTLFHLEPSDPVTVAAAFTVMIASALAAAWIPARRASRIDPVAALREE
jgi:predicted permease